jgi:hypothetical protein
MPVVPIDADEPAPDARPVPEVMAADDEVRVDTDDSVMVDEDTEVVDAATLDNTLGAATAELSGVDAAEVSGATTWALVPADVPTACPTAAA